LPNTASVSGRAGARELGILGEKTVAGVDGVGVGRARYAHDVGDIQVRLDRPFVAADQIRLVRLGAVEGEAVLVRVHRDRAQAKLARRAHHADGDLAAVGDQNTA